jgi:uncharacterized protein (TIRG00374 family)
MLKNFVQKYWLLLFFLFLFLFTAFSRISLRDVWDTVIALELWQLSVLLGVYFLISLLQIFARKYLLLGMNHSCRLSNLTFIHFSTMAAHYSTPAKIGFPLTVYLLKRFENIPYPHGTAITFVELTASTGICGIIAFIGGIFYFGAQSSELFLILLVLVAAGVILIGARQIFLKTKPSESRLGKFILDIGDAFSRVALKHLIFYICMLIFIQFFASFTLVLTCYFFQAELSIWQAVTAGSTAFFIGAISMIPMGLGTRDASLLFYLKFFGISSSVGISIVAVQRLLSTGLSFVLGVIFSSFLGLKNIRVQNNEDVTKN